MKVEVVLGITNTEASFRPTSLMHILISKYIAQVTCLQPMPEFHPVSRALPISWLGLC